MKIFFWILTVVHCSYISHDKNEVTQSKLIAKSTTSSRLDYYERQPAFLEHRSYGRDAYEQVEYGDELAASLIINMLNQVFGYVAQR